MIFKKKKKCHRQDGMNAFDKKVSRGIVSVAGIGLIAGTMTSAYAAPENIEQNENKSAYSTEAVLSPNLADILQQTVQIPVIDEADVDEQKEQLPEIQVVPKPEPKPEPKPVVVKKEPVETEEKIQTVPEPVEQEVKKETEDVKSVEEAEIPENEETVSTLTMNSEAEVESEKISGFAAPLKTMNVSSPFGYRIHPVYGSSKLHAGTDFNASCGTTVYASASGKVVHSGFKNGRAGNIVEIDHGMINGKQITTSYYHLSKTSAVVGENVEQGDIIGEVGTTGTSTGCHLHWAMDVNGEKTDPMPYLNDN